jgi:pimeloyl-ACP methyl ester carboxylesterase
MEKDVFIKHIKANNPKYRLLWLHGWGQSHKSFIPMAEFFDQDADSYLFDLHGFGASPLPPADWGTEEYGDFLAKWIEENPSDLPTFLIGHSFGCRVSIRLASKYPNLANAMILIGAAGLQKKLSIKGKIRRLYIKSVGKLAHLSDSFFQTEYKKAFREKFGSRDYKNAGKMRLTFVKTVSEDLTENAKEVKIPTLLLFGEKDTETPTQFGLRYEKLIKNSKYIEYKGLDHYSVLASGKSRLIKDMKEFIKKQN